MPEPALRAVPLARAGTRARRASRLTRVLAGAAALHAAVSLAQQPGDAAADAETRAVERADPGASAPDSDWAALFNGRDLAAWTPKIRGHSVGENYADTFRVRDGLLTVAYDGYSDFAEQFGHLFHAQPFSYYRLRIEYRFVGEQAPNAPDWAARNSGVMVHAQPPATMRPEQDFPISVEVQFLGGLSDGRPRPTGNMCSPGTHVVHDGGLAATHCVESSSPTFDGDQWVLAETLVLGGERIVHFVNGERVLEYGQITRGGGVVSGHDPAMKVEGARLGEGYIALQSEGHPIQFRRVELLSLAGCTDPGATTYKDYVVAPDPSACRYDGAR